MERLASLADALLARAQGPEVLGRLGDDVIVKLKGDTASWLSTDGDIEEDAAASRLGLVGAHDEGGGGQLVVSSYLVLRLLTAEL